MLAAAAPSTLNFVGRLTWCIWSSTTCSKLSDSETDRGSRETVDHSEDPASFDDGSCASILEASAFDWSCEFDVCINFHEIKMIFFINNWVPARHRVDTLCDDATIVRKGGISTGWRMDITRGGREDKRPRPGNTAITRFSLSTSFVQGRKCRWNEVSPTIGGALTDLLEIARQWKWACIKMKDQVQRKPVKTTCRHEFAQLKNLQILITQIWQNVANVKYNW